jgi:UPF0716 protein FxsA
MRRSFARRVPWWVLALLFVVLPVVEIYVLIRIGHVIGGLWTVVLLVADGVFGSWLMKREGTRTWQALREALATRRMPARELADAALILVGGTLLLTPGFVSDVFGLFCVLPFTRPLARRVLTRFVTRRFLDRAGAVGFGQGSAGETGDMGGRPGPRTQRRPGPDVVQGDVVD